jgi:hypothetical protein
MQAIHYHRMKTLPYFEISVQSGYNCEKVCLSPPLAALLTVVAALPLPCEILPGTSRVSFCVQSHAVCWASPSCSLWPPRCIPPGQTSTWT